MFVNGNKRKIILSNLQPDANYSIVISAFTSKGEGSRSASHFSKTAISGSHCLKMIKKLKNYLEPVQPPAPFGEDLPTVRGHSSTIAINLVQPSDLNGKIK